MKYLLDFGGPHFCYGAQILPVDDKLHTPIGTVSIRIRSGCQPNLRMGTALQQAALRLGAFAFFHQQRALGPGELGRAHQSLPKEGLLAFVIAAHEVAFASEQAKLSRQLVHQGAQRGGLVGEQGRLLGEVVFREERVVLLAAGGQFRPGGL